MFISEVTRIPCYFLPKAVCFPINISPATVSYLLYHYSQNIPIFITDTEVSLHAP